MLISIPSFLSIVALFIPSNAIIIRPPRPNVPNPPPIPKPLIVPAPIIPALRPNAPIVGSPAQQQQAVVVQANVQRLENRLKIEDGVDFAGAMVDALLPNPQTTTDGAAQVTPPPTPTSTIPHASLASCSSYAAILSSCASATPQFFDLSKSQQVSCACYAPYSTERPGCTVLAKTWDGGYDGYEQGCYDMFKEFSYTLITGAMDNVSTLPGRGLCASASSAAATGTGTAVRQVLAKTTEGTCQSTSKPTQQAFVSGAWRWRERKSLFSIAVAICAAMWQLLP